MTNSSVLTPLLDVRRVTEATASKPKRILQLDVLRGFLLLWMTLTHLPTRVSFYSNQAFGLVSAAEGFILLAGFMVGQIEFRAENKGGEARTIRDLFKRATRIYLYHFGMLALAFTVVAAIGISFHRLALTNLLSFYMQHPRNAIIGAALLVYRPSLFDILPMYIVFMLVTPVCRRVASRFNWAVVIALSGFVWLLAQFGFRSWFYDHVHILRLSVPRDSTGAFDMWGWQLLWVVGLALGSVLAARNSPLVLPRGLVVAACTVCVAFFFVRHTSAVEIFNVDPYAGFVDKWHLGPLRLVNAAAIVVVLIRFGGKLGNLPPLQPLAALGQTSLEVFCVHVLCCLMAVSLNADADPMLEPWQEAFVLVLTLTALFATPIVRNAWVRRTSSRNATT